MPRFYAATDMPGKVKVLHLIASPKIGGAEKLLLTILDRINTEKYELALAIYVGAHMSENALYAEVQKAGIPLFPISISSSYDVRQVSAIYRSVKSFNPDIIHTHGYKTNILGYLIARAVGVPIMTTVHGGLHSKRNVTRFLNYLNQFILRHFDLVIAVSEQIEKALRGLKISESRLVVLRNVPTTKIQIGYNRDSLVRQFSLSSHSKFVGCVGRLEPVKGTEVFISAALKVLETSSSIQFLVVGEGSELDRLKEVVAQAGRSDQIRFLGFIPNPGAIFKMLDLYVLPSFDEGIPLSLLEAMSVGVPVIASSVGGVPEIIVDGLNGILVPPGQPELLAEAIRNSLTDQTAVSEKIYEARRTIDEKFNVDSWIEELQDLYQGIKFGQPEIVQTLKPRGGPV